MTDKLEQDEAEIEVMRTVLGALRSLEPEDRSRVFNWVASKLDVATISHGKPVTPDLEDEKKGEQGQKEFSDFAALCSAADPTTDAQKALVAGYWLQACECNANFGSQECNNQLKHFGLPVGNITRAFELLKTNKPSFANQLEKKGSTKQGRKKYRLTHHGIQEVKRMLDG